jgi:transposase-like protein
MRERLIRRYSGCFKRQVIEELEAGRFGSIEQARQHYGIGGRMTVQRWLRRYGKNHLQAKVVRVEKPGEADQVRRLKAQVAQLERALGQTQAQRVLDEQYLKLACAELGEDVAAFQKKCDGRRFTPRPGDVPGDVPGG